MSLPRPGDLITAIDGRVLRGIAGPAGDGLVPGYFRWNSVRDSHLESRRAFREDTEGLSWIRGWHDEDSDEVRALLAADKLWQSSALVGPAGAVGSVGPGPCPTGPQGPAGVPGVA